MIIQLLNLIITIGVVLVVVKIMRDVEKLTGGKK
jgi:hypothetical protein